MRLPLLCVALALAGCAEHVDPAVAAAAAQPVVCTGEADCAAKWSRAVNWVVQNSHWKIQTQTDQMIATFNPIDSSTDAGFTVTKVSTGGAAYEIDMSISCDNLISCIPGPTELKANFNTYVLASG